MTLARMESALLNVMDAEVMQGQIYMNVGIVM